MEEPNVLEELDHPVETSRETLYNARRDFSKLGLWLVLTTILFEGMQIFAAVAWEFVRESLAQDKPLEGLLAYNNVNYWVRLLPTYLIAVPLILCLGKKLLKGTVPEKRAIKPRQFLAALGCTFGVAISCNLIGLFVTGIIGRFMGGSVENVSVELISGLDPLTSVILVSLGAPICEELIFRKMLVTRTLKYGEGVSILLSGLAFGLFHGNFNQFAYAFGIGTFFAYIFVKTGNIKITIALHACVNGFTSVVLTNLIQALDMQKLNELMASFNGGAQNVDLISSYTQFVAENMGLLVAIGLCVLLEYGVAIFGIIFLLVNLKKLRVNAGEVTIPKGKRFFVIFCNLGMIIFLITWILQIFAQIMGWI